MNYAPNSRNTCLAHRSDHPQSLYLICVFACCSTAASGDEHGIEYTIANVAISGLSASATPALHPTGAMISLAVSALQLNVNADVHLKEKSWPHAHLSAKITATSSSSSAAVGLSVSMDAANKAQILLNACSASISLKVKISHLGIFDKVADFIVKEFSGTIKKEISDAICKEAFPEALATANKALEAFSYFAPIPLPAPFKAEADVHLSAAPGVISSPNATYMGVSSRASFLTGDGHADPSTAPALPQLGPKDLGSHMVTVQVSAYPFQSAAWALYTQGGSLEPRSFIAASCMLFTHRHIYTHTHTHSHRHSWGRGTLSLLLLPPPPPLPTQALSRLRSTPGTFLWGVQASSTRASIDSFSQNCRKPIQTRWLTPEEEGGNATLSCGRVCLTSNVV